MTKVLFERSWVQVLPGLPRQCQVDAVSPGKAIHIGTRIALDQIMNLSSCKLTQDGGRRDLFPMNCYLPLNNLECWRGEFESAEQVDK
jgi:hypothetical protein